jgi:hypothetical protein
MTVTGFLSAWGWKDDEDFPAPDRTNGMVAKNG